MNVPASTGGLAPTHYRLLSTIQSESIYFRVMQLDCVNTEQLIRSDVFLAIKLIS